MMRPLLLTSLALAGGLLLPGCPELNDAPPPATTANPPPAYSTDEDLGVPPPAGTASSDTSTSDSKSDWSPTGTTEATKPETKAVEIDLVALENAEPLPGSEFNKFFPEQGGEYDIVYKQEKEGFAAASWQKDGEEVAFLTVADLAGNSSAADKYRSSTEFLDGYPVETSGSKGTVVLVGSRFQVQARASEGQLNHEERKELLSKFNLDGIAELAN